MMGYLNNLFIYGIQKFAKDISGTIDAVICVDLPSDVVEEKQLNDALKKENIALIKLITPTTSEERIKDIVKNADGFIYSVNVKGQTGVKSADVEKVNSQIEKIKNIQKFQLFQVLVLKMKKMLKFFQFKSRWNCIRFSYSWRNTKKVRKLVINILLPTL